VGFRSGFVERKGSAAQRTVRSGGVGHHGCGGDGGRVRRIKTIEVKKFHDYLVKLSVMMLMQSFF